MRTSILGVINYSDITQVIKQTIDIGITTHTDPRSLAACRGPNFRDRTHAAGSRFGNSCGNGKEPH